MKWCDSYVHDREFWPGILYWTEKEGRCIDLCGRQYIYILRSFKTFESHEWHAATETVWRVEKLG